jgi:hypothetical protein
MRPLPIGNRDESGLGDFINHELYWSRAAEWKVVLWRRRLAGGLAVPVWRSKTAGKMPAPQKPTFLSQSEDLDFTARIRRENSIRPPERYFAKRTVQP